MWKIMSKHKERINLVPTGEVDNFGRSTYKTICANPECKKPCTIPFLPFLGTPVYCADCFRKIKQKENEARNKAFDYGDENDEE
jgi:CxxC-x17-CxxC domain-containing protein